LLADVLTEQLPPRSGWVLIDADYYDTDEYRCRAEHKPTGLIVSGFGPDLGEAFGTCLWLVRDAIGRESQTPVETERRSRARP